MKCEANEWESRFFDNPYLAAVLQEIIRFENEMTLTISGKFILLEGSWGNKQAKKTTLCEFSAILEWMIV